ncbi:MAG: helix-turn-helix domain-containing protein [Planctomycetota bacterium]
MAYEGGVKPAKDGEKKKAKRSRTQREEEVRKKYDFSVIRTLRQKRNLTIERFAKLCGLSYAPISRIETNLIKPNLETLDKIAAGLGVTTYNLVALAEKRDAEKLLSREFRSGAFSFQTFAFEDLDVSYGHAPKGAEASRLDVHNRDIESVIVQSGRLEMTVNDKTFEINAGECVKYDRVFPHSFKALDDTDLVVISHSQR